MMRRWWPLLLLLIPLALVLRARAGEMVGGELVGGVLNEAPDSTSTPTETPTDTPTVTPTPTDTPTVTPTTTPGPGCCVCIDAPDCPTSDLCSDDLYDLWTCQTFCGVQSGTCEEEAWVPLETCAEGCDGRIPLP
jgi:hypothetical protein